MNTNEALLRLKKAIAYLKGNQTISTQQDIANAMGYNKGTISQAVNNKNNYFTIDFVKKFAQVFDLNDKWIITGDGEMTVSKNTLSNKKTFIKIGDRVKEVLSIKKLNYRSLSMEIPYSDVQIRRICLNESIPKVDFIHHICKKFPDINIAWLINGNGSMFLDQNNEPSFLKESKANYETNISTDIDKLTSSQISLIEDALLIHEEELLAKSEIVRKWINIKLKEKELEVYKKDLINVKKGI
ncbi:protein of unknown function [Tenacibaculum sp. 190524A02b]|uniref:hypothetical protein n=1 Tax=Tenacibaculum vairaonense TaxID=3137860 RepID=UPI0032B18885